MRSDRGVVWRVWYNWWIENPVALFAAVAFVAGILFNLSNQMNSYVESNVNLVGDSWLACWTKKVQKSTKDGHKSKERLRQADVKMTSQLFRRRIRQEVCERKIGVARVTASLSFSLKFLVFAWSGGWDKGCGRRKWSAERWEKAKLVPIANNSGVNFLWTRVWIGGMARFFLANGASAT
jgi:hypothetical protein